MGGKCFVVFVLQRQIFLMRIDDGMASRAFGIHVAARISVKLPTGGFGKAESDKVIDPIDQSTLGKNARLDLTRSGEQLKRSRKGQVVVFEKTP